MNGYGRSRMKSRMMSDASNVGVEAMLRQELEKRVSRPRKVLGVSLGQVSQHTVSSFSEFIPIT